MNAIFNIIGIPLGYVLWFIYRFVGNYFVSIFLFTLIVRAATFPLSLSLRRARRTGPGWRPAWNGFKKSTPRTSRSSSKSRWSSMKKRA